MNDNPASILFDINGNAVGVSGSMALPTGSIGQLVAGVDTSGTVRFLPILSGALPQTQGSNAIRTFVSASASDVLLLSNNTNRLSVILYNDSNALLYVGFGHSPVSTDDFTLVILAHAERGFAFGFTGELRGAWETATGVVRITEMT